MFSNLDLTAGYHQLELHPDSRYITTFTTQLGLRRYKRLNFGVSSVAEVFQNTIRQMLQGIADVKNLSDDSIIYGATLADHDKSIIAVFQRLKEQDLTLNRKKCEFNKNRLEFFGFIFSDGGVSADPRKVESIKQADDPKDAAEVRGFLGIANYFIPDFATLTEPLRKLTRKDTPWQWIVEQDTALNKLKDTLTSDTTMSYFNPNMNTELIVNPAQ